MHVKKCVLKQHMSRVRFVVVVFQVSYLLIIHIYTFDMQSIPLHQASSSPDRGAPHGFGWLAGGVAVWGGFHLSHPKSFG